MAQWKAEQRAHLRSGAKGDPLAPIEDLLSGSGGVEGDEQAAAQGKVPLGLPLHRCIGLGAVSQLVPLPPILPKVLQASDNILIL